MISRKKSGSKNPEVPVSIEFDEEQRAIALLILKLPQS